MRLSVLKEQQLKKRSQDQSKKYFCKKYNQNNKMVEARFIDRNKREFVPTDTFDRSKFVSSSYVGLVRPIETDPTNTFIPKEKLIFGVAGQSLTPTTTPLLTPIEQSECETIRELLTDDTFLHNAYDRSTNEHMVFHGDEYLRKEDIWHQVDKVEKKVEDTVDRTKDAWSTTYHNVEQKVREVGDQTKEALIGARDRIQHDINTVRHNARNKLDEAKEHWSETSEGTLKTDRTPETDSTLEDTQKTMNKFRQEEHLTKTIEEQLRPDTMGLVGEAPYPYGEAKATDDVLPETTTTFDVVTTAVPVSRRGREELRQYTSTEYANVKQPFTQKVFEPKQEVSLTQILSEEKPIIIEEEIVIVRKDPMSVLKSEYKHMDDVEDLLYTFGDLEPTIHMWRQGRK